jgi:hypothetical protein
VQRYLLGGRATTSASPPIDTCQRRLRVPPFAHLRNVFVGRKAHRGHRMNHSCPGVQRLQI